MSAPTSSAVSIRVLLFASYAEAFGLDAIDVRVSPPATVGSVLARLRALPGGERLPPRPLCAVNLSHAQLDTPVNDGDELAVLPPVAGG